jgi:hypothetical protein
MATDQIYLFLNQLNRNKRIHATSRVKSQFVTSRFDMPFWNLNPLYRLSQIAILFPISKLIKILFYQLLNLCALGKLIFELCCKPFHLFVKRFAIVFNILSTDITTGRENIAMSTDLINVLAFAEAGDVLIFISAFFTAPCVIYLCDPIYLLVGELPVSPVDQMPHLTGIYE